MKKSRIVLVVVLVVVTIAVGIWLSRRAGMEQSLVFANPNTDWWTSAPVILGNQRSAFGPRVSMVDVTSGLASKNSVVAGTADIGLTAATPLALAAGQQERIVVLGTYLSTRQVVGIAVPAGSPQTAAPPAPVAIVPNTISEWYLYSWLEKRGLESQMTGNTLNRLTVRPPDVVPSVTSGSAKSAVIWEPFLSRLKQPGIEIWRDPDVQEVRLFLVTRPDVVAAKRPELEAFLTAFDEACRYIMTNRAQARSQIQDFYKIDSRMLDDAWESVHYGITHDVEQMKALILRDAGIAMKLNRLKQLPAVDYLFVSNPPAPRSR